MCHSDRDWSKPGAPPIPGKLGAGSVLEDEKDYRMVAPNLTPDPETGAGRWTDDMLARAIREGVGHDGRALAPLMWYESFRWLPDEDLASVVVYLRSLPAVRNRLPSRMVSAEKQHRFERQPKPITSPVPAPEFASPVERGRYLARMADCVGCHTYWYGDVNPGYFAGGNLVERKGGYKAFSANITPDPSGISYYDAALFREVLRTGTVRARKLSPLMPWIVFRKLNDEDLNAIFAFLSHLKPVHHSVANGETPFLCALCGQTHGYGAYNKAWKPVPAKIDPAVYKSYEGKYRYPDGTIVTVTTDGPKLYLSGDDGNRTELIPQSENVFVSEDNAAPLTFEKDAAGKVTHFLENSELDPVLKIQ